MAVDQYTEQFWKPKKFLGSLYALGNKLFIKNTKGITAGTTQTQAGATPLLTTFNFVDTCANANDGVLLPDCEADRVVVVTNKGAAALKVWPSGSDTVNGGTASAADTVTIPINESRIYCGDSTNTNWKSIPIGDIGA
jgi:hypothetical protein